MDRIIQWLEQTEEYVDQDYDRIIPVIGDEGKGKSTLIMQLVWLWRGVTDQEQTVEACLTDIAWDLQEFKEMLGNSPPKRMIVVHDAARVLSRKKAMHGSQIDVEEDLLDARFGNYVVLLGYQDFDIVPTMLATRRAKNLLRIPTRGSVHGHNESNIRKRYEEEKWPDPVMRDTFPSLEGKNLWRRFVEEDQKRKRERIQPDEDEGAQFSIEELAEQVKEDGVKHVLSLHGGHNKWYIDSDLIEIEYGVSGQKAKKTAKLLKRDVDPHQAMEGSR